MCRFDSIESQNYKLVSSLIIDMLGEVRRLAGGPKIIPCMKE
jgi:hypothetical protein